MNFVKGEINMYENNNNVSIDWKSLFLKVIIVALIIFVIFKAYEMINKKESSSVETPSTATQLFNANLESLRQAGENYYDYTNYPSEGQTVMTTLGELQTKGNIKELYDANGNECNRENSYVSLTNDGGKYKLKATLTCGETSNYTVVQIGCECEEAECVKALKDSEENSCDKESTNTSSKTSNSSSSKSSNTKSNSSSNSSSKDKTVNYYNNSFNTNSNNNNSNSNNNENEATTKKTTQVVNLNDDNTTTTKKTTTKKYYDDEDETQYKVTFDSNGGTSVATQLVSKYDTAYEPEDPDKDDARFIGWYYNGKLWDFDTKITKNIRLEAYYWETKTLTKQVYSAAWDTYGTTYVTVTHKLAIPAELQDNNIKNVKIKSLRNARTMSSTSDLVNYRNLHASTYDGYQYSNSDSYSTNVNYLGRMTNIRVRKENSYEYDRWVVWNANVSSQCRTPFTINGQTNKCDYGIVYTVVWEYDVISD